MPDLESKLRETLTDAANAVQPRPDALTRYRARRSADRSPRLGLSIAGAVVATVAVVGGVIAFVSLRNDPTPQPGANTGVERDLTPTRDLSPQGLQDSATILSSRLAALGVHGASVVPKAGYLEARVPAAAVATLAAVASTQGVLRFRRALELGSGAPAAGSVPVQRQVTHAPTLTKALQRTYNSWDCKNSANPTRGRDAASDYIVACSNDGSQKYLLAPTAVPGTDIDSAGATYMPPEQAWVVVLSFNGPASEAWQRVTERAYNVNNGQPQIKSCRPPKGCNAIAITLDGVVESAPYISQAGGIAGGRAEISDNFTQQSANRLATILKYGALPTAFAVRKPALAH